jgi:L-lactate dehydrogenase (cytochrome)
VRADHPLNLAPATVNDYRELARRRLPRQLFDYIDGGAYEEATMRSNVADLERLLLRQVVMRDVSTRAQEVEVLGQRLAMPVILAPVGLAGMFARRAELQAARAAQTAGIPFTESTVSICDIEEEELMARAQSVGAPVLIVTVDLAVVGARKRDIRNAVLGDPPTSAKLRRGLDLVSHPRWMIDVALRGGPLTFGNLKRPGQPAPSALKSWIPEFDPSVTWEDVAWVREHWNGPLVVKGVLDPEDARHAAEAGVDGVVVSNHGGRQLDSVLSTTRALSDVVDAIGDRVEVLADGGVRTGLDVVKFLSLGARAVLIGRAWAWSVAARGEAGVRHMLEVIKADIDVALALTGHTSVSQLDRAALYRQGLPVSA